MGNRDYMYNPDQIIALWRGVKDRVSNVLRRREDFVFETRGKAFSDKRIFIVRRGGNCGLFSYLLTALSGIKYALDRGWIPVIDLQTLPNIYLEPDEVGVNNAWEYYFDQPCGLALNGVASARDIVITKDFDWPELPPADISFLLGQDGRLAYWRRIVKDYIFVKQNVWESVQDAVRTVFDCHVEDVLGVFIRGSDYTRIRPLGHTVQPKPKRAAADARRLLRLHGMKRVFLVTEDRRVIDAFRAEFPNELIMKEQNLVEYTGGYIGECTPRFCRKRERYLQGFDYLLNVLLLAQCPCLLASRASGSIGAALFSKGNQVVHYYDLGVYTRFGIKGGTAEGYT